MRIRILILAIVSLVLAACAAGTDAPASPTPRAPADTPAAAAPGATQSTSPEPAVPAGGVAEVAPTPTPRRTTATATPAALAVARTLWPHFLRELDFGIPAGNTYSPRALAVHPGLRRLYVRTYIPTPDYQGVGTVTVLDLDTGVVQAVARAGADPYAEGNLAVDAGRNRLYVLSPDDNSCIVLDAETLARLDTLEGVVGFALDAEGSRLYVAGLGGLRVLDTEGYEVLAETDVTYALRSSELAVDTTQGRFFVTYQEAGAYALGVYDAATLNLVASVPLPGPPDDLLPDPARARLYLTLNDGENSLFWTLDSDGQVQDEQPLGEWTRNTYLALDSAGSRLFLSRDEYKNDGITVLDLETGQQVADLPLDSAPTALLWAAEIDRLLVSHTYENLIRAVDVEAGGASSTYPTARDLVDLAVDPGRGHLYVTDSAGQLRVLDSDSDQLLATLPGAGRIAVDSPHGRFYTGGGGASRVRIFDADSLQQTAEIESTALPVADAHDGGLYLVQRGIYVASLETLTITTAISDTLPESPGFSPNPSAVDAVVDPGSGRIFAIINNGVPGSNNGNYLYVYEPLTFERIFTDTERSPIYIDVDPNSGRAYVSRTHLAGRSTSLLEDGRRYTARLDAMFGALRVNPALGYVYLSDRGTHEGYLLTLDAVTLDVLGSVPIPGGYTLRALDYQRDLLYLATEGGKVQIWSATGGQRLAATEPVPAELPLDQVQRLFLSPDDATLFAASLYRSEDEGATWQYIGSSLPERQVQELVTAEFNRSGTLFAVMMATDEGLGIWKSRDGGQSWQMANAGLSDLAVSDLAISPAYAEDQTLFATTRRQGLFRSTDGGKSWLALGERYAPQDGYVEPAQAVVVSPTYGRDGTLFVAHKGLHRSTDGGETWSQVLPQGPESLALSPAFADDGTAFGWFGSGGLLRSSDGGETWSAASVGLSLSSFGRGRVLVSPDYATSRTLYFIWTPSPSGTPAQFFRSTDGAASWQQLAGEVPQGRTPVQLSADGAAFLALDDGGRLARWPVAEMEWQAAELPPIAEIDVDQLLLSPTFDQDRTLLAVSEGAGILRSTDAGLTWTDLGYPLRSTAGTAPEPLMLAPDLVFLGTPLGLYRFQGEGPWTPVAGGLPQGLATSGPVLGADGSMRVLAGSDGRQEVYLSTDEGQTWTQPLPTLPDGAIAENLLFSPAFASDRTAFFAPSWGKPQRTVDGGAWQEFGPAGDWNLSAMQISPAFDRDGTLVMRRQDNSLWRSTDGGDTWTAFDGPWDEEAPRSVTPGTAYILEAVTFSPAFAQDGVLLAAAGDALYRSSGGHARWNRILDLGNRFAQALFSPDYEQDGTIYLLQGNALYRSTDRGQSWRELPAAPWGADDEISWRLSPTFASDETLLAWTIGGSVYRSTDGGQSWRDASAGLASVRIHEILFVPDYAAERLAYLVPHTPGLYKQIDSGPWQPIAEGEAAPAATDTPAPAACTSEPDRFREVWQQVRGRLGCPQGEAVQTLFAEQPFEGGLMLWDSSTVQIYALQEAGSWAAYDDTFVEGVDPSYDPDLEAPEGKLQPVRGFGKVWREQLGGPQSALGWALADERPVDGWRQPFEAGLLVWTDDVPEGSSTPGTAYLLYQDSTWQAIGSPAP